ncbi:leucine-rich repeat and IQ domain-containing protein 3-like isoform X2 [Heterodontus francisci]|uniref:leucine-rich repeat and IQ domain-containing protein 3-like isoform X2 n=1 Tax=Heterodontus francisci TaxID=7792 RepID=UPI00355ACFFF
MMVSIGYKREAQSPKPGAAPSLISPDIRRLVDSSHLVSPSKSLILSRGEMDHMCKEKKLEEIVVVNLTGHYLKNLGYLTNCSALKICILPRNYITEIDALSNCPNLIKLDLHGNHITDLPDEYFWSDMKSLQVLYLHNNIIGDMNSVESLFQCPSLVVLTLFDTPVSLVPKYRHHIVNSIWSLKALDNFVIADAEVIEDWPKSDQFKALSPHFFLHFPLPPQISTWQSELKHIRNLIATINNILAHQSPVLILQRRFRGYLARKKLGAASIPHKQQRFACNKVNGDLCSRGIHVLEDGSMWVTGSSSKQDDSCNTVHLKIDRNKLHIELLEDRCEANEITSGLYPHISRWNRWNTPNFKPTKSSVFRHRAFRQPDFAPAAGIFELMTEEEVEDEEDEEEDEEDADKDSHEILKLYPITYQADPAYSMLLSRLASGADVRLGIQQLHEMLRNKPQPKFTYQPPISLEKRLYAKSYGCMTLAPFMAIQKAYGDREKAAKQRLRMERTRKLKLVEDTLRSNLHSQALMNSYDPFRKYKEDKIRGEQVLLQRKIEQAETQTLVRHNNFLFLQEKSRRALDHQLAKKFSSSCSLMSEIALKHQIKEKNEIIHQQKVDFVQRAKKKAEQLKKEIRDVMMHKQLIMQAENIAARTAVNTILSEATRDRLLHARAMVVVRKARQHTADSTGPATAEQRASYPQTLPGISPHPSPTQSETYTPEI